MSNRDLNIFLVFDSGCGKCDVLHPEKKCVDCNTGPLCNTQEFINNSKFCLWKTENMAKPVGMKRVCSASCFVLRDKVGKGLIMKIGKETCGFSTKSPKSLSITRNPMTSILILEIPLSHFYI